MGRVHGATTWAGYTDLPHDLGTRIYHVSWVHKATLCTPLLGVHPREQRLSENKLVTTRGEEIGEGKTGMKRSRLMDIK